MVDYEKHFFVGKRISNNNMLKECLETGENQNIISQTSNMSSAAQESCIGSNIKQESSEKKKNLTVDLPRRTASADCRDSSTMAGKSST